MPLKTQADALVETMREWLPEIHRQTEDAGREAVQTVVWVVGLASGLIVIGATNKTLITHLSNGGRHTLIGLLVAAAILGVAHRVVYHFGESKQRDLFLSMQAALVGLTTDTNEPLPLAEWWDRVTIIEQLQSQFDVNYTFLDTHDVPIEKARGIYAEHYEKWHASELQGLKSFGEFLAAAAGKPKGSEVDIAGTNDDPASSFEDIRSKGQSVNRWRNASYLLFFSTCLAFVGAVAILGVALAT